MALATYIPIEIIEEDILHRLEVVDLIKLKSVCKSWLKLISSPEFIHKHKRVSRNLIFMSLPRFMTYHSYPISQSTILLRSLVYMTLPLSVINHYKNLLFSGCHQYLADNLITRKVPYPSETISNEDIEIMGSCDGLLCLLISKVCGMVVIFNPSTQKSKRLNTWGPYQVYQIEFYWFGHHPCTGEYTVVLGTRVDIKVISLSSCGGNFVVRNHGSVCYGIHHRIGTPLHGSLHWPVYGKIVKYNFSNDKILEFNVVPFKSEFTLGVLDGCLFAVSKGGVDFELWVMKDYGLNESWVMYGKICGYGQPFHRKLVPLGFLDNGDLLIDNGHGVLSTYSFKEGLSTIIDYHAARFSKAIMFQESLVSPDIC